MDREQQSEIGETGFRGDFGKPTPADPRQSFLGRFRTARLARYGPAGFLRPSRRTRVRVHTCAYMHVPVVERIYYRRRYGRGRCGGPAGAAREQISIVSGMGGREHAREKTPGTRSRPPSPLINNTPLRADFLFIIYEIIIIIIINEENPKPERRDTAAAAAARASDALCRPAGRPGSSRYYHYFPSVRAKAWRGRVGGSFRHLIPGRG